MIHDSLLNLDVTDAWLQEQVNTFQSSAEKKEKQVDEMRRQIEEEKGNEAALRRKLRSVESQKGLLQGDAQVSDRSFTFRPFLRYLTLIVGPFRDTMRT